MPSVAILARIDHAVSMPSVSILTTRLSADAGMGILGTLGKAAHPVSLHLNFLFGVSPTHKVIFSISVHFRYFTMEDSIRITDSLKQIQFWVNRSLQYLCLFVKPCNLNRER